MGLKNKKILLICFIIIFVWAALAGGYFILNLRNNYSPVLSETVEEKPIEVVARATPLPVLRYESQEYGFRFYYPSLWGSPRQMKIEPLQEKVMSIVFSDSNYVFDLYNQLLPVPASSFLRTYFADRLIFSQQNNQNNLVVFSHTDESSAKGVRSGFVGQQDKYLLTLTKDSADSAEQLFDDDIMVEVFKSVVWLQ